MQATHERLRADLAHSPFGRPLLLEADPQAKALRGDVYAVIDQPFPVVSKALAPAPRWCDILILQSNVKRCVPSAAPGTDTLQVAVGRKFDQPIDEAFLMDFKYARPTTQPRYFAALLTSDTGPLGTSAYRLALEAVPVGPSRTFVRMSYSYESSAVARLATDAYLATAGRRKVGFTVTGRDASGAPVHVGGVQGIAERNTMRYFLALEAYLAALDAPAQDQVEQRLRAWFDATERYPLQLREMTRDEYLAMKRREAASPGAPYS